MKFKSQHLIFLLLFSLPAFARLHWELFPIVDYDSDVGLGYGCHVSLSMPAQDTMFELWRVEAEFYATTKEVYQPYIECLLDKIGPGRFRIHVSYDRILYNNYYGFGNSDAQQGYSSAKENDYVYTYQKSVPKLMVIYDVPAGIRAVPWLSNLRIAAGICAEKTDITESPKTPASGEEPLLFAQRPLGIDGGFVHKEIAGLVLNNCDDRIDPATGVFFDLYGVGSSTALLSSYSYVHATARLAGYATPFRKFDRLVVFGRLLVDYLRGGAPFYEYENTVGFSPEEIFGGEGSMRGIPEYRFRDRFSFVITPECRLRAFPFSLFGTDYNLGPVVFSDIGNTFPSPLLMKPVLYVTYGTGLRLRWDHDFVATLQFAFWKNTLGGVYLSFDEQY